MVAFNKVLFKKFEDSVLFEAHSFPSLSNVFDRTYLGLLFNKKDQNWELKILHLKFKSIDVILGLPQNWNSMSCLIILMSKIKNHLDLSFVF